MTSQTKAITSPTTNLILYGPPGTGKTYRTALEAVRLCLGAEQAEILGKPGQREALMAEYRKLVSRGRIEFVTFHQSMSYEEFVEGLRPSLRTGEPCADEPMQDEPASAGFQLMPHDGVFKRISDRAEMDSGDGGSSQRLNRRARLFRVQLGSLKTGGDLIGYAAEHGIIFTDKGGDIDWSDKRFVTPLANEKPIDIILDEWNKLKDKNAKKSSQDIVAINILRAYMNVGDYVLLTDERDYFMAFGKVSGEYYFEKGAAHGPHRRRVEWKWRDAEGVDIHQIYSKRRASYVLYVLDQAEIKWEALETIIFGEDKRRKGATGRDHVLIIDEINRANISKVFGELITLLEPDKRLGAENEICLTLPYSKESFGVPANLHIIGTMNTADRSIALLDTALRRRFAFCELMPDPAVLAENVDGINLRKLLSTINERIEYLFDREHQIGHAYFTSCRSRADIEAVLRDKVIPLLLEYFYEDWSKVAIILGDTDARSPRFLERTQLTAPAGMDIDGPSEPKLRWQVLPADTKAGKRSFDLREFELAKKDAQETVPPLGVPSESVSPESGLNDAAKQDAANQDAEQQEISA